MPVKKATKLPNICAGLYLGDFHLNFDCIGVEICKYALCPVMPPDGTEDCAFLEHGSCLCPGAKYDAMKGLRDRLAKEMVRAAEEEMEA
jgi:hypothetical protein